MTLTGSVFSKVLQKVGSWTEIRTGSIVFNSRGDETVTWTTGSGEGYVQVVTDDNELVKAGILRLGDAVGYFTTSAPLGTGSRSQVGHQGIWYDAHSEPIIPTFSGNQLIKKVILRRQQT